MCVKFWIDEQRYPPIKNEVMTKCHHFVVELTVAPVVWQQEEVALQPMMIVLDFGYIAYWQPVFTDLELFVEFLSLQQQQ